MPGLSDTLITLARYRRSIAQAAAGTPAAGSTLAEVSSFGANPGNLRMLTHVPAELGRSAPLVVVLHGCTQTAAGYDGGAGWSELADRFGFALLLPEQQRANNAGGCFNWFLPEDIARGGGEAASIRAMVQHLVAAAAIDPRRVFVTGLSAGGAFANVLLAVYPDVFAGGAIVAGLPYGAARDMPTALATMSRGQDRTDHGWGDLVRAASSHRGPWPSVQVWHGGADTTVIPANGTDTVRQWLDVHGLAYVEGARDTVGAAQRVRWGGGAVTLYTLPRLGHAVPISADDPDPARRSGAAGPFVTECGVPSSYLIAQSWGLTKAIRPPVAPSPDAPPTPTPPPSTMRAGPENVIVKALRAAGLMH